MERKPREKPPREVQFDGAFEARLITLASSSAPEGHTRWTVRLLADKAVELNLAFLVSPMTIQRIKKNGAYASHSHQRILENTAGKECGFCSVDGGCYATDSGSIAMYYY